MAALRRDLTDDVQSVSQSARALTDWRNYVMRFPFAAAGAALAAGFFLVPKRPEVIVPDPETLAAMAKKNQVWVKTGSPKPIEKGHGVMGGLLAMAVTAGTRLAMTWAQERLKTSLAAGFQDKEASAEDEETYSQSRHYPPR
jgi:hypothetical protein